MSDDDADADEVSALDIALWLGVGVAVGAAFTLVTVAWVAGSVAASGVQALRNLRRGV